MIGSPIRAALGAFRARCPRKVIYDQSDGAPYLERYYLIKSRWIGVVLHHILRPDSDERLHNHPWRWAFSLILAGGYVEERLDSIDQVRSTTLRVGRLNKIGSNTYHRISALVADDVWTLFVHGAAKEAWGFLDRPNSH